jgi:hypothetical protein
MIKHQLPSPMYVLQSLTLTGGIDINWLVLLFVQLTLLAPLLLFLFQKTKRGEIIIAVSIIVFTFLSSIPEIRAVLPNYRFVMWVGWSYFFLMGYRSVYPLIVSARKKTYILITLGLLTALFAITSEFSHLYDNKYPPTLSFTLYGAVWILVLSKLLPKLRIPKFLEAFIHFFSIYSYPLFFVHYWILVYVSVYFKLNWYLFFLIVLFSSAGIQFLGNTSIQIWRNSLFPGKGKHV